MAKRSEKSKKKSDRKELRPAASGEPASAKKWGRKEYEEEMARLQGELHARGQQHHEHDARSACAPPVAPQEEPGRV